MKELMQKMAYKMRCWMAGRYGVDELSKFLSMLGLVLIIISTFPEMQIMYLLALIILGWSLFRTYSKKIYKRQAERAKYLQLIYKLRGKIQLRKRMWSERKTHRYIKCKKCKTMCRVPKGKGKIKIKCSKCGTEVIKKV